MPGRGHETFDHTADMGIRGWADNLPGALEETAQAMFEMIFDGEGVDPEEEIEIIASGNDRGEILVEFLNELLTAADMAETALTGVAIGRLTREEDGRWTLEGAARGVKRSRYPDRLLSEVKAATWQGLSVREDEDKSWVAQCVIDM